MRVGTDKYSKNSTRKKNMYDNVSRDIVMSTNNKYESFSREFVRHKRWGTATQYGIGVSVK